MNYLGGTLVLPSIERNKISTFRVIREIRHRNNMIRAFTISLIYAVCRTVYICNHLNIPPKNKKVFIDKINRYRKNSISIMCICKKNMQKFML